MCMGDKLFCTGGVKNRTETHAPGAFLVSIQIEPLCRRLRLNFNPPDPLQFSNGVSVMAARKLSREEVEEMVALALRSGLTERDIAQLPSVHKLLLSRGRHPPRPFSSLHGLRAVVLPLALLLLLHCALLRHPALRLWFWLRGSSVENEMCVVGFSDFYNPFRQPLDCRVCSNITAVHRKSNLSHEEFLRAYAYSMQPVVVEDGQRNWSAREVFSFQFFTQIYGSDSRALDNSGSECQFFPYDTEFLNLGDVFGMEAGRAGMHGNAKPWYIGWSNCDSSAASILRQHYKRPYFIPAISESSKMDWIFMGVPGHGAHMHIDDVDNPSWQAQIRGIKHWKLEPPAECYYECSSLEAIVYPGQIIVLDTNKWFHETHILGEELSITIGSEYD